MLYTTWAQQQACLTGKLTGFLLSHTRTVSFMAWSPDCIHLVHLGLSQSHLSRRTLTLGKCFVCNGMLYLMVSSVSYRIIAFKTGR